jgi:hypothetical protein
MAWSIRGLLTTIALLASAEAAVLAPRASSANVSTSTPIPPRLDPWYTYNTATLDFAKKDPGAVLKIRHAPGNLTHITSNCSATYNVMYRTTDSRYKPTWAVTTVFVPVKPVKSVSALLSYQIPYDSAFIDASPSYAMYSGVSVDVNASLAKGWFVSVPDYEGPLASFTAGVMSGHATLDSIRAIQELGELGILNLTQDARYAMWGYSGGALASEWAAELQVQYAPELNISGAALGGLTPNVTSVILSINKGYSAGLMPVSSPTSIATRHIGANSTLLVRHPWPDEPIPRGPGIPNLSTQGHREIQQDNLLVSTQLDAGSGLVNIRLPGSLPVLQRRS